MLTRCSLLCVVQFAPWLLLWLANFDARSDLIVAAFDNKFVVLVVLVSSSPPHFSFRVNERLNGPRRRRRRMPRWWRKRRGAEKSLGADGLIR
ncbi:unnamed protein product [Heligmosomoides polygyrus]|uniref:Secreted protein n=1 Tax=Heligmosomoides polygyrus TaxID=6339 RepID=A0A183FLB3_HELPZ|nr:unnamed protein product [Heligmosomoides polygyrus]